MVRLVQTVAPAAPPVTLAEIKAHAVVEDFSDDDVLLTALRDAAVAYLDGYAGILGRCMVSQTWQAGFVCWPRSRELRLPFPDVSAVSIVYSDAVNDEQTLVASAYELLEDRRGAFVRFGSAFTAPTLYDDRTDRVRISLTAGYGDASAVPAALKTAICMLVTAWYENRGGSDAASVPLPVTLLTAPFRRIVL